MSALREFVTYVAAKRLATAADQKAFDEALARLDRVVKFITRMKADAEKMQTSLRSMGRANPAGFVRLFNKYVNTLKGIKLQAETTLDRVENIRKKLAPKGVDTSRFNPLVQQVEDLKDFAFQWLEPDPFSKLGLP